MMPKKRCHCGSELIDLFTGAACKAECDLPASMRTSAKAAAKKPTLFAPAVTAPMIASLYIPAVGDWVRLGAGGASAANMHLVGTPCKITMIGRQASTYYAYLDSPDGRHGYTWEARYLEAWSPEVGERVYYLDASRATRQLALVLKGPTPGLAIVVVQLVCGSRVYVSTSALEPAP